MAELHLKLELLRPSEGSESAVADPFYWPTKAEIAATSCRSCSGRRWVEKSGDYLRLVVFSDDGFAVETSSYWKDMFGEPCERFHCQTCKLPISPEGNTLTFEALNRLSQLPLPPEPPETLRAEVNWLTDEPRSPSVGDDTHFVILECDGRPVLKANRKAFHELDGLPVLPIPYTLYGHVWALSTKQGGALRSNLRYFKDYYPVHAATAYTITQVLMNCPGNQLLEPTSDTYIPLSEIAVSAGVHQTTVYRLQSWIRAQTPDGRTGFLEDFLPRKSHKFAGPAGELSREEIKEFIRQTILTTEPRPSDQRLTEMLLAELGAVVARRTVAKYRSQIVRELDLTKAASNSPDVASEEWLSERVPDDWEDAWKVSPPSVRHRMATTILDHHPVG
jgi:hypothetical protein